MVKIGCVGYGGRHGEFFSRVFNQQNAFPGYHMSYVFGEDEVLTPEERQRRFFQVEHDCSSLDELIRCSDAVMILTVRGEDHARYALKVIEAGKPLFVDKPFTASLDEAREITRAAEAWGVPLFGGSTLRHLQKVEEIQALMQQEDFPAVGITYRADPESPLGAYPFYASHTAEMCVALCGPDYRQVEAVRVGKNICTLVRYDHRCALLTTTLDTQLVNVHLMGKICRSFDLNQDLCHVDGARKFVRMLETGVPPVPYNEFCSAVGLVEEIMEKISFPTE